MSALGEFLQQVRDDQQFQKSLAGNPRLADSIADVEEFFGHLERRDGARTIELHDEIAGVVSDKGVPIKDRLLEIQKKMAAAMPWIPALRSRGKPKH